MAGVTLGRGADMSRGFGLGIHGKIASAMAGRALPGQTDVVHLSWRKGDIVLVTSVADCGRWNMSGIFAQRVRAIVATGTGARSNTTVIVSRRFPERGRMAGITRLAGRDVSGRFGAGAQRGIGATVTSRAQANRTAVIHIGWLEAREVEVTVVTLAACRQVVGWFAKCGRAVMTGRAAATTDDDG